MVPNSKWFPEHFEWLRKPSSICHMDVFSNHDYNVWDHHTVLTPKEHLRKFFNNSKIPLVKLASDLGCHLTSVFPIPQRAVNSCQSSWFTKNSFISTSIVLLSKYSLPNTQLSSVQKKLQLSPSCSQQHGLKASQKMGEEVRVHVYTEFVHFVVEWHVW